MIKFQIFGSASSQDYDVMVFVDELHTISENHELIKKLNVELETIFNDAGMVKKKINANIGVLGNGQIVKVFKGFYSECNNALFHTYKNHKQLCGQHITSVYPLTRDIAHLKLKRCFRFILSFYSRIPEWRPGIKAAMRGGFDKRLEQCKLIDFRIHTEFPGKDELREDIYKVIAFQFAQTYLLLLDIEIYSKEEVLEHYPFFKSFINRQVIDEDDLIILNTFWTYLLVEAESEIGKMKSLDEEIHNIDTN